MADIEALMYTYPVQGSPGFTSLLSQREEFWPTEPEHSNLSRENISRNAVKTLCERFMLVYDRLFLYYYTGAGKTVISSGASEPLVRNITTELANTYLNPVRSNLTKIIVIVTSDSEKRDFMNKIIETSTRPEYVAAAKMGMNQPIQERMATYAAALSGVYVFHTKTSFITKIYGSGNIHGDVDPKKPDPTGLAFANNSIIIMDEIQTLSREEATASSSKKEEEIAEEEDFRYAQFHFVLHTIKGSKIIGMSGTPMKDSPREIIKVLNLILPTEKQIPQTVDVLSRKELLPYLEGYVSFFRTPSTKVINRGIMVPLEPSSEDFDVIFPVAMSDIQAKGYQKISGDRDPFNRNSLRTSNIIYQDGTSDHASFASRFNKSARGWDGMEPNDAFRSFLRQSRSNRESLSPKFCASIDIVRISKGVVFIFDNKLEGGLFDLAAFLDAEGFERYTPAPSQNLLFLTRSDGSHEMLIQKKPRYCLVIGETKNVPGRLENITGLANLDENADGEYVKVILGSTAIQKAFDIRNSITMIYLSPSQTESSQIQTLGRIIRTGSQKALLEKYPSLPSIISVYKMASYLPGTDYEGVDVKTYLDSAKKDRKIKIVERMLRDSAVDCKMLHSINYNPEEDLLDDSPACLYGPCDYVCVNSSSDDSVLDSSAMDALYRGEKNIRVRLELAKLARERVYIPLPELTQLVDTSTSVIQRVLETMNITKDQLRDKFGRQVYLYHDKNGVFFATSPVVTGTLGDGSGLVSPISMREYEFLMTTSLTTSLDLLSGGSGLTLPGNLESILINYPFRVTTTSLEDDLDLLKRFSLYVRREVVSKAETLEHVRVRGEQRIRGLQGNNVYWVDYSGLLYTRGDLRIYEGDRGITSIVDKNTSGLPLHLHSSSSSSQEQQISGSWTEPTPNLMRILQRRWRSYMRDIVAPFDNKFLYYGVIRPTEPDVLRIATQGKDNAKKTPGRALASWGSKDLQTVVAYVLDDNKEEAKRIIDSQKDLAEFLKLEFEKRDMLLRL